MKDPTAINSQSTMRSATRTLPELDTIQRGSAVGQLPSIRVGDKIIDHIRIRLNTGELAPGDKLPSERELAEQLGVCRNAVRESLRVLEAIGVLTIRKGHTGGAFVSNGNVNAGVSGLGDVLRLRGGQVNEISEVRLWLSEVVARAACERRTSQDLEQLNRNLTLVQQLMAAGDLKGSLAAAAEFHVHLAACSQNSLLVLMMETIMGIASQFACDLGIDASEFAFDERRAIVKAIKAREVSAAITAMKAHLDNVHSRYRSSLAQS